jgi:hypothetical protein
MTHTKQESGNTNHSKFELYALLGEVYGAGCPIGYLLLQSRQTGKKGGKERYLRQLLEYFKNEWKIKPIITLSDKDWSEINALHGTFPEEGHQLCFWHCLRAVKKRLSTLRQKPNDLPIEEVNEEFPVDVIDPEFCPMWQAKAGAKPVKSACL